MNTHNDNTLQGTNNYTLVTGGTGLVGSHLIKALLHEDKKVKALYRKTIPQFEGSSKVIWVQGDVLDVFDLDKAMEEVEHVYHCAAVVSFHESSKHEMFKINVDGTANVVNACIDNSVKKLCYVSSVAALGKVPEGHEIDETSEWNNDKSNSNYSKSKHFAEMEVWRGIGEGLNAVIVNPSIILGAGDWSKGSSGIFKTAYDEFPWYTEGVTGFVDVEDVVRAMIGLMNSDVCKRTFYSERSKLEIQRHLHNHCKKL